MPVLKDRARPRGAPSGVERIALNAFSYCQPNALGTTRSTSANPGAPCHPGQQNALPRIVDFAP
jgi:hypothetical protein